MGAEVYFQPELLVSSCQPLPRLIINTIKKCKTSLQSELFSNIVIHGGSSMFDGMKERLEKEIKELVTDEVDIKVIATTSRNISVWIGGSILGSYKNFGHAWINKHDYDDIGPLIIDRYL